jgi:hypothetical protein
MNQCGSEKRLCQRIEASVRRPVESTARNRDDQVLALPRSPVALRASPQVRTRRNDAAVRSASAVACSRESRRPAAHAAANDSSPSAARAVSIAWRL